MKISASLLLSSVKSASVFDDFCNGRSDGLYQYPWDCGKFYQCAGGRTYIQNCGTGTVFDPAIGSCNWPHATDQSGCDLDPSTTTQSTTVETTEGTTTASIAFTTTTTSTTSTTTTTEPTTTATSTATSTTTENVTSTTTATTSATTTTSAVTSTTTEAVTTTTEGTTSTTVETTSTATTTAEPTTSTASTATTSTIVETTSTSTTTAEPTTSTASTATSTTNEPATTDCSDGNNGGCSHFCNNNECACPDCWSMKSDGKTCLPQNDLAEITCSASGMRLELHQCVLPGVAEPTLLDTDCAADLVGDTFVLETSLDGCDTAFVVDNDVVTFSNYLLASGGVTGGIITSKPVQLEWSCDFALNANVNLTTTNGGLFGDIDAASAPVEVSFGIDEDQPVYGAFKYTLAFYEDDSYSSTMDMDSKIVSVGDTIYAAVSVDVPVAGLEFTIEECVIEDPAAGMSLTMIDAQCGEAIIDTTINSFSDSEMITFSFMGFLFPSGSRNWSQNSQMQLSCSIYVCDDSDSASICSVDPNCGGSSRKRRSAEINRSLATNSVNFHVKQ